MAISLKDLSMEDRERLLEQAKKEIKSRDEQAMIEHRLAWSKTELQSSQEARVAHIHCDDFHHSKFILSDKIKSTVSYLYKSAMGSKSNKQLKLENDNQFNLYKMIYTKLTDAIIDVYDEAKKMKDKQEQEQQDVE